jgi:hypothetical protein
MRFLLYNIKHAKQYRYMANKGKNMIDFQNTVKQHAEQIIYYKSLDLNHAPWVTAEIDSLYKSMPELLKQAVVSYVAAMQSK